MNKVLTVLAVTVISLGLGGCASMMSLSADMARVGAKAASGSADVLDKHAAKREAKDAQEAAAEKPVPPPATQPTKPAKTTVADKPVKKPTKPAAKPQEG